MGYKKSVPTRAAQTLGNLPASLEFPGAHYKFRARRSGQQTRHDLAPRGGAEECSRPYGWKKSERTHPPSFCFESPGRGD